MSDHELTPGIQVVCIDDSPCICGARCIELHKGSIYTIARIYKSFTFNYIGLELFETVAFPHETPSNGHIHMPLGFRSNRFRPVKKTSIDIFEQIRLRHSIPKKFETTR